MLNIILLIIFILILFYIINIFLKKYVSNEYFNNENKPLNEQINIANEKINLINNYGNANLSTLPLLTNYREQNYITLITDKINEVNIFSNVYYAN